MKSRKSQMEIMGLAIVVILITLIMLFVVRFVVLRQPAEYKKEFTQTELASNIINTLLKTNAPDCSDLTFTELFQDCAEGQSVSCNSDVPNSCSYIEAKTNYILDNTLKKWNIGYEFNAFTSTENIFQLGSCPGEKKSKRYPIPTSMLTLYITLDICELEIS